MIRTLIAISFVTACSTAKPPVPLAPTTASTVELAAHRAQMIGWLHDYAEAGVYPTDAGGQPLSVFRDDKGVRCPMAELIHKSGRDDLVDAVVAENNAVRLADVHDGPLHDWMLSSGLTEREIAMVQGAMNINMIEWRQELAANDLVLAAGRAEVKGKIETAEIALRDNTATSLVVATKHLDHRDPQALATTKIAGKVVPKSAIAAARPAAQPPLTWGRPTVRFERTPNGSVVLSGPIVQGDVRN